MTNILPKNVNKLHVCEGEMHKQHQINQ